ncbi:MULTISPECIES: DUF4233 domain-containing protein [Saccharomonospora]|jgi:hypothetical protein|uniref:DUF4233 domain-containing protein n=2 Tax=Saccharomonospora viridis TaxID=1852 RepID=C7MPP2_SACVD|nr:MULTISPECIES: DUF4233 domain-containing protein [Saccharomonospora]ACU96287.1 hypothetical protein Svir_12380 [Saccharomonospora viridis DSM 43017]SFO99998.1 Protein of unknown function [Saccharomonospora viridis]
MSESEAPETVETAEATSVPPPATDPMKGFRGVQAGTLVLEAIVVGLALPVVAQLGDGLTSLQGWTVSGIAVGLLVCTGLLRFPWSIWVILALNVGLLAFVVTLPWVAVIGVMFLAVWGWLMWLRRDVARRMARGLLPSQQQHAQSEGTP